MPEERQKRNTMRLLMSARWRHEHRRALRLLIAAGASLTLLTGIGTVALAATSGGSSPFGDEQVGGTYANGILLATQQWIKPIGTRVLLDKDGRLLSSAISPNGRYLAALTWNDFTGWLTIVNVKTGQIIQQVGTGATGDPVIGDGTVAADGPVWSADGKSLWFPQTSDLVHFTVSAGGTVSGPVVIPLSTTINNLTTGTTTVPDGPSGMALSQDGTKLYVALNIVNELGVIDTATNKLVKVIKVGNAPRQVVLVGNDAFVSNEGGRPAKPGDYTNNSAGTNIVANKVTGAASTGTVSEVNLVTGKQTTQIRVGLEPSAEYLAGDGTLMVANSNNDSISLINPKTAAVEQTVNVNPLPGTTVGSNPNAITMPNSSTVLVSIGRDNALAVYGYSGPRTPLRFEGLLPTDFYPVNAQYDPAIGKIVVTNDKGIGARGTAKTIDKGPGTAPGAESVTGPNTYSDTGSLTEFSMPSMAALGGYTSTVFRQQQLGSPAGQHAAAGLQGCAGGHPHPPRLPVQDQARVPDHPREPHLRPGSRRHRQGQQRPGPGPVRRHHHAERHKLASTYGLFDNFYDEGTLSADGHNWLMQADANDYIEKEFGAFYRSYPAQGGDALAYQRDGFLWNAAEAAGQTVKAYGEYNNFLTPAGADPVVVRVLPGFADPGRQGHGAAARADLGHDDLRRHPLAQRHRRSRLPGVQPGHPGPVPDRHLGPVLRPERQDGPAGQPQPDLDAG